LHFIQGILSMNKSHIASALLSIGLLTSAATAGDRPASPGHSIWQTVANNGDMVPEDGAGRPFNSYNPPSVSREGLVVFRGRSREPEPPASGIFARDMSHKNGGDLYRIAVRGMTVPSPNNTGATFNEFSSFARIAGRNPIVATRGNSEPVWRYETPEGESRMGTSGVFAALDGLNLETAMTQLGVIPGLEDFQVPGVDIPPRFDQFPGAPSPTDKGLVLTKGNYTVNEVRHTGIFYRDLLDSDGAVKLIANTATQIPNVPEDVTGLTFGSTAPPSAADDQVVFCGLR
jgi:hypothetical protein